MRVQNIACEYNKGMNEKSLTQTIIQYPTDLVFALMTVDVSSQLTILAQKSFYLHNWLFDFAIIGESHFVTIKHHNKFVMQEVLACTDLPVILQAESHKFAKLETYQVNKVAYQASVEFSSSLPTNTLSKEISGHLDLSFPEVFGVIPSTHVQWSYHEQLVTWQTLHVYPLENHVTYVRTQSQFDLNRED